MGKLIKILLAFLGAAMLTACWSAAADGFSAERQSPAESGVAQTQSAQVEVERIVTSEPVVELRVGESRKLQYTVLPYGATDKSVSVDLSAACGLVAADEESDGSIVLLGKNVGTGVVSLVSSNGKFVSYSVTVAYAEAVPPEEPTIFGAIDVVRSFNAEAEKRGLDGLRYSVTLDAYVLRRSFGASSDDSLESLKEAAACFVPCFPKYMMILYAYYFPETYDGPAEADVAFVNSNHSVCALICSKIESGERVCDVMVCDVHDYD